MVIPGNGFSDLLNSFRKYRKIYTFSNKLVPVFFQLGASDVSRLPFAFSPNHHFVNRNFPIELESEISYFGSWGPIQEEWLKHLDSDRLKIFGPGWQNCNYKKMQNCILPNRGQGKEMIEAINASNIVFNLVRAEHLCGHSMKTFEIPASGGFMITNWTEEQSEFLIEEKHCIYFNNIDEFVDKINFYSKKENLRNQMRENAYRHIQCHTYVNRVKQILRELNIGK